MCQLLAVLVVLVVGSVAQGRSVRDSQSVHDSDVTLPPVSHAGVTLGLLRINALDDGDAEARFSRWLYGGNPIPPNFDQEHVVINSIVSADNRQDMAEILVEGTFTVTDPTISAYWRFQGPGSFDFSGPVFSQHGTTDVRNPVIGSTAFAWNGWVTLPAGEYSFRAEQFLPASWWDGIWWEEPHPVGRFEMVLWSNVAPEPSTWALAAVALLVLFAVRRHRR